MQAHPMKVLVGLIGATLLAGCATREDFEIKLNGWLGTSEATLVAAWGPPSRFYETTDIRFLTYSNDRMAILPGSSPSYQTSMIGGMAYSTPIGGYGPLAIQLSCTITFEIRDGRVANWRYQGNNCYDF